MTKLLEQALDAVRVLPEDVQDRIAAQLIQCANYRSDVEDDDTAVAHSSSR